MNLAAALTLVGLLFSFTLPAQANDGVMGGAGSDLVPMKETDVSMVSEDIVLTYAAEYWHVEADYVFRNNAKEPQALQLGFPEYRCEGEAAAGCLPQRSYHFENMVTSVRGKPVKHRKGRVKREHAWAPRLGNVWLFDLKLAPEEQVNVRHTYRVPASYDSSGGRATRYVTRTGALWAGPIGLARFRVRVPLRSEGFTGPDELERTSVTTVTVGEVKLAEVLYEVRDFAPDYDLSFYVLERHGAGGLDGVDPDLAREGPARSGLADSERCQNFLGLWELGYRKASQKADQLAAELSKVLASGTHSRSICEATVYAKYGKRFDDDRLNRYFYGAKGFEVGEWPYGWMRPNPGFDPSWLEPDDLATLELIRTLPERALVAAVVHEPSAHGAATAPSTPPPPPAPSTAGKPAPPAPAGCHAIGALQAGASPGQVPLSTAPVAALALLLLRRAMRRDP
jgi:hypothetical protein